VSAVVGNTDPVSLTDAELAAEVARDTGEVLLAVTHPGGSHPAGKPERTVLAPESHTTGARTPRTQPLISSVAMKGARQGGP
jgi:hypothetical protein